MLEKNRKKAVDAIASLADRVETSIWLKKHDEINMSLLTDHTFSSGERLLIKACIGIWNGNDGSEINLGDLISLEEKYFDGIIKAILTARSSN